MRRDGADKEFHPARQPVLDLGPSVSAVDAVADVLPLCIRLLGYIAVCERLPGHGFQQRVHRGTFANQLREGVIRLPLAPENETKMGVTASTTAIPRLQRLC